MYNTSEIGNNYAIYYIAHFITKVNSVKYGIDKLYLNYIDSWKIIKSSKPQLLGDLHFLYIFLHEIKHFVNNLYNYLTGRAINNSGWQNLLNSLFKVKNINEVS